MFLELDVEVSFSFLSPFSFDSSSNTGFEVNNSLRAVCWLCCVLYMPLFGLVGKARQPVDETNGSELKLQFACNFAFSLRTFAENHLPSSILGSSVWWFPLLIQSLTRFSSSSLFPLNLNPLHFNHRFNWPTVYSSGSLSNLEPGTSSSSVRTVKDGSEPLAIHTFPLQPLQNWRLFVWLTTGV